MSRVVDMRGVSSSLVHGFTGVEHHTAARESLQIHGQNGGQPGQVQKWYQQKGSQVRIKDEYSFYDVMKIEKKIKAFYSFVCYQNSHEHIFYIAGKR